VEEVLEVGVLAHPVAVPADVDDVAVVDEPVDQCARHDVIPKDLAPLFEAFIGREHGARVFVAAAHELESRFLRTWQRVRSFGKSDVTFLKEFSQAIQALSTGQLVLPGMPGHRSLGLDEIKSMASAITTILTFLVGYFIPQLG